MKEKFRCLRTLLLILALLSGCSLLLPVERRALEYYVIQHDPVRAEAREQGGSVSASGRCRLLVDRTTAAEGVRSSRIMFAPARNRRGHYQFSAWLEPLPQVFERLLIEELRSSHKFCEVSPYRSLYEGDFLLKSVLIDAYHDLTSQPSLVKVQFQFELVELRRFKTVARETVLKEIAVETPGAVAAVAAFNLAISETLTEVPGWVRRQLEEMEG